MSMYALESIVLLLAAGIASGHVIPAIRNTVLAPAPVVVAPVASQYHAQDELGQYTYGYAGGPSAKHETKTLDGVTRGGYSYVDGHGLVQSAEYVSDPINGFRVAATNLPAGPAVPAKASVIATAPVAVVAAPQPAIVAAAPVIAAGAVPVLAAAPAPVVTIGTSAALPVDISKDNEIKAPAQEVALDKAAENDEDLLAAERIAAAKAASTIVQDTQEVEDAKKAHLALVEATRTRDEALAAIEAEENAINDQTTTPAAEKTASIGEAMPGEEEPVSAAEEGVTSGPVEAGAPALVKVASAGVVGAPVPAIVAPAVAVTKVAASVPVVAAAPVAVTKVVASVPVAAVAPVAVANAAVIVNPVITSQYHAQDELGQYTFGYAGGPSAKHETKTFDGITRGGYSYIDAHGEIQSTAYVSDPVNGFRVAATNLPVQPAPKYIPDSPEVAEAKTKLFKLQADHVAKL